MRPTALVIALLLLLVVLTKSHVFSGAVGRTQAGVWSQASAPTILDGVSVGDLWYDTSTAALKVCTSLDTSTCTSWTTLGTGTSVPSGTIAYQSGSCPTGWTEVIAARGRMIVGLPSGGTSAGTVGTALTDLQDKTHTHSVTATGAVGSIAASSDAAVKVGTSASNAAASGHTHAAPAFTGSPATSTTAATSDVLSYIQYRVCSKD